MIDFICGEVVSIVDHAVVLKCNSIGYQLNVSATTTAKCKIGDEMQLYTYLQVREDCLVLYGFYNNDERNMFFRLTTVSGVGPKIAMSILSGMSINDLAISILKGDIGSLCSIKGLGKKSAERIILELKEKISPIDIVNSVEIDNGAVRKLTTDEEDAMTILMSLGINRNEALRRIKKAIENGAVGTEEILNTSLRS